VDGRALQLRAIEYADFASEETNCFMAEVWINGEKKGVVKNDGHGGEDAYFPWTLETELDVMAKTLPDLKFQDPAAGEFVLKMGADLLVAELFEEWLSKKMMGTRA
jgi:hypothetical protein